MSPIATNLQGVQREMNDAVKGRSPRFDRPVVLVAVSKTKSAAAVREAFAAGQRQFGENYVQEGVTKVTSLEDLRGEHIEWHMIGPLQSNKAKLAATHFDWVHTVDRTKIADALSRHRLEAKLPPLNALLQVNVSGEASKSGVVLTEVAKLAKQVVALPGLRLRGLMSIIENAAAEDVLRQQFRVLREAFDELAADVVGIDTLSMGMSGDFPVAIDEGSTMIRVGSRIFGARS